jgi:hypothetical protein
MTLEDILETSFITKKLVWSKRGDKLERREVDISPAKITETPKSRAQ